MTDFRVLCAELADALNDLSPHLEAQSPVPLVTKAIKAWKKACTALAQPEPQQPSVMDIIALADEVEEEGLGQVDLVRRALARWGHHTSQGDCE